MANSRAAGSRRGGIHPIKVLVIGLALLAVLAGGAAAYKFSRRPILAAPDDLGPFSLRVDGEPLRAGESRQLKVGMHTFEWSLLDTDDRLVVASSEDIAMARGELVLLDTPHVPAPPPEPEPPPPSSDSVLQPGPPRDVHVRVTGVAPGIPLKVILDQRRWDPNTWHPPSSWFRAFIAEDKVKPFMAVSSRVPHTLTVRVGECPATAEDCTSAGNCPTGCAWKVDPGFTVPEGEGVYEARIEMPSPQFVEAGPIVTVRDYLSWATQVGWSLPQASGPTSGQPYLEQLSEAQLRQLNDEGYSSLPGHFEHYATAWYLCEPRGGIASMWSSPTSWDASSLSAPGLYAWSVPQDMVVSHETASEIVIRRSDGSLEPYAVSSTRPSPSMRKLHFAGSRREDMGGWTQRLWGAGVRCAR